MVLCLEQLLPNLLDMCGYCHKEACTETQQDVAIPKPAKQAFNSF
jgi:hypothetical protein